MNAIIGDRTCRSCRNCRIVQQEAFCYRNEPSIRAVPIVDERGKSSVGLQLIYSKVNPDKPCGEYERSEAFASEKAPVLGETKP